MLTPCTYCCGDHFAKRNAVSTLVVEHVVLVKQQYGTTLTENIITV